MTPWFVILRGRADAEMIVHQDGWIALATSRSVVQRATVVALVVGSILVIINHGDAIVRGDLSAGRLLRIVLTIAVPYCVSTYSSVSALRDAARPQPSKHLV